MKYFVVSDLHGRPVEELLQALKEKGFDEKNSEHNIISAGDMFDRGHHNIELLEFFMNYYKKGRAILLWGNHDFILKDLIDAHYNNDEATIWVYNKNWIMNGTMTTAVEFLKHLNQYNIDRGAQWQSFKALKQFELLNKYFSALNPFVSLGDYLVCHSGCTNFNHNASLDEIKEETWNITDKEKQYSGVKNVSFQKHGHKKVVFGHYHVTNYHDSHDIYEDENMVAIDSWKQINVFVINK